MELWTAQFGYSGPDRLDVTYKTHEAIRVAGGGELKLNFEARWVAPTKEMVHGYKYGWPELDQEGKEIRYVYMYHKIMEKAWEDHLMDMYNVVQNWPEMTIVCYCKSGEFCHRLLLVEYMRQLGAIYMGER